MLLKFLKPLVRISAALLAIKSPENMLHTLDKCLSFHELGLHRLENMCVLEVCISGITQLRLHTNLFCTNVLHKITHVKLRLSMDVL